MTQNRNPLIPVYFSAECCMRPVEVIYFVQVASESMEMLSSFHIKQFEKIDSCSFYHYHYYTNNILNTTIYPSSIDLCKNQTLETTKIL